MVAIDKSEITQDIWKNFFDILNNNVSDVTATDNSVHSVQFYASAFPDKVADSKSSYPIVLVESPNLSWEDFTFTKKWVNGTITLDVFSTKAEVTDKMIDDVINLVETARDSLRDLGLMNVSLDSTDKDEFFRGQIKVHVKSATFTFRYIFTKTQTY